MLYFSLFSGELISTDEEINDPHHIPLKRPPLSNCKKCYGRFYSAYNLTTKQFEICTKCLPKCLDEKYILEFLKKHSNG